jgi:hypothetical protein
MTKEELKNAISETIYSNGKKGISGDSLANLLNEIVDAVGEGGAGSNILIFNLRLDKETGMPITTSSVENLQFRKTLIEGINNNKSYSVLVNICMDMSDDLKEAGISGKYIVTESGFASYIYINTPGTTLPGLPEGEVLILSITNAADPTVPTEIVINSDGSITIEESTTEESTTE